jgi:hypothetical protein
MVQQAQLVLETREQASTAYCLSYFWELLAMKEDVLK